MEKLNLTDPEKQLFTDALHEAYQKGSQDATFLANNLYQLVETASKCVPVIVEKYTN